MAYTKAQQDRLDAAQKRVDETRPAYEGAVGSYNSYIGSIKCYDDQFQDAATAIAWWNPQRTLCKKCAGSGSKDNCQGLIDDLNQNIIPALRSAYGNYNNALINQTTVLAAVTAEAAPQTQIDTAAAAATASAQGKKDTTKWLFFGLIALIIIGAAVWMLFKMPQIKKWYVIGGGFGLLLATYLIFFGTGKK